MNQYDLLHPVRKRSNGWEVLMIKEGSGLHYILCDSREDAELVADARRLNGIAMNCDRAEFSRVQRCIDVLRRYGLDPSTSTLVRRLMRLAAASMAA